MFASTLGSLIKTLRQILIYRIQVEFLLQYTRIIFVL